MSRPINAVKTLNNDGSISWKWEDSTGFHTFTENLPQVAPIFFYPWLKVPIPPKEVIYDKP